MSATHRPLKIAPKKVDGLCRPHRPFHLSETAPLIGSVNASTQRGIVRASPTCAGFSANAMARTGRTGCATVLTAKVSAPPGMNAFEPGLPSSNHRGRAHGRSVFPPRSMRPRKPPSYFSSNVSKALTAKRTVLSGKKVFFSTSDLQSTPHWEKFAISFNKETARRPDIPG